MFHSFENYASFTDEIFGQLLSNYSRYAADFNMKAVSFFYPSCIVILLLRRHGMRV